MIVEVVQIKTSLESRMQGNLHGRIRVGAGVKLPDPHHADWRFAKLRVRSRTSPLADARNYPSVISWTTLFTGRMRSVDSTASPKAEFQPQAADATDASSTEGER